MTLDDMLQECAMYVSEELTKTNDVYAGEMLDKVKKFMSGINYAYKKICREKFHLTFEDIVNPGDVLTKPFYKVLSVKNLDGSPVPFEMVENDIRYDAGTVKIKYEYIPSELVNLTDVPEIPEEKVDHRILCYFGAFQFLNINDDERAEKWLSMWEDAFSNISSANTKLNYVVDVYGGLV